MPRRESPAESMLPVAVISFEKSSAAIPLMIALSTDPVIVTMFPFCNSFKFLLFKAA